MRRALSPPGQARADWQILVDLMRATGLDARYAVKILDEPATPDLSELTVFAASLCAMPMAARTR